MSIIIPVRDRAHLLMRCLDSVSAQSYRPLQVIVVDNGSGDSSMQIAIDWGRRVSSPDFEVKVLSEPRPSAALARHTGAVAAEANVLAFVDSDDALRPDYATSIMEAFAGADDIELAYWRKMSHDTAGRSRQLRFTRRLTAAAHIAHGILNTLGCAVSRELYMRSGGWDTSLRQWDDWELGIRYITALKGKAARIDKVLVDIHTHADSITGPDCLSAAGRWEQAIDAAERHAASLPAHMCRRLLRLTAFKRTILAALYRRENDRSLAAATLEKALATTDSPWRRMILRIAFAYTARGLRGAASWALPLL